MLTVQMVFFSLAMIWAYPSSEYNGDRHPKMSAWRAIVDSLNFGTPLPFRFRRILPNAIAYHLSRLRVRDLYEPQVLH